MSLDVARRNRPWVANDPADAVAWDGPGSADAATPCHCDGGRGWRSGHLRISGG